MSTLTNDENTKPDNNELIIQLFLTYYETLMSFVSRMVNDRLMAEDVVQDIFCEAVKKAELLAEHPNPGGWLMETARNKMGNLYKRLKYRETISLEDCQSELIVMENEFGVLEVEIMLENSLDAHERMLFRLYFLQGYTAREIARMENISESNLKVKIHRMKKKWLEKIGDI